MPVITICSLFNNAFCSFLLLKAMILVQAAPDNIIVGSHVWVEDSVVAWIGGEVTQINGQEVHVNCKNGKKVCALL